MTPPITMRLRFYWHNKNEIIVFFLYLISEQSHHEQSLKTNENAEKE